MNIRTILTLGLVLYVGANVQAKKTTVKKSKPDIKMLSAQTKSLPYEHLEFVLVWEKSKYPQTFFWRGENGWLPCVMERAHKNKSGVDYIGEKVSAGDIRKGDTLMLVPITGGRFAVPKDVPATAKNILYYKTGGSGWLSFPVKKTIGIRAE